MPGFDKTGPEGGGPMTGRGQGWCGSIRPDQQTPGGGYAGYGNQYGFGRRGNRGFGLGRGRRAGFSQTRQTFQGAGDSTGEVEALKMQVERLRQTIDDLLQKTGSMEKGE